VLSVALRGQLFDILELDRFAAAAGIGHVGIAKLESGFQKRGFVIDLGSEQEHLRHGGDHDPRAILFDDLVINDEDNHDSAWIDVHDFEKLTLYLDAIKTSTPGNLTITVFVSPQAASILNLSETGELINTYDKLIDSTGVDSPVSTSAFSATGEDILGFSQEDSIRSVKVRAASASTTDATKFWTLAGWLVGKTFNFSR